MTEEQFWSSNPRRMKPYIIASEERKQEELRTANVIAYINGIYTRDALICTVGNMFSDKNSKKLEYPSEPYDFFKKQEVQKELTEEEKIEQTKALFMKLDIMKSNFELAK